MDELAELSGELLIAQLVQMTLLIAIAWLALKLVGNKRPHLSHMICLVVLAKCLLPPIWSSTTGVLPRLAAIVEDTFGIGDRHGIDSARPFDRSPQADFAGVALPNPTGSATADEFAALVRSLEDETVVETPARSGDSIPARIAFWWIVSALTMGVFALLRVQWLLRSLRRSQLEASPELEALLEDLCSRLRIRRCVRLLVTSRRVGPAVIGLFRPLLVLPDAIVRDATSEEIEPILAHELLHVRRGDLWVGLLQMLAEIFWWFHPLVKAFNRALSREAERCCDEEVVAELGYPPSRYARCLLNVLERKQKLAPVPAFPGVRAIDLTKQRLERIMELGNGSRKRTPWWCWIVALALAALVLPGRKGTGAEGTQESPGVPPTTTAVNSDQGSTPARPSSDPVAAEQSTGKFLFGTGVNSDAGVIGSLVFNDPVQLPGPPSLQATGSQPAAPAVAASPLDKKITVNFRRTPLIDALEKLAREAGCELMLDVDALKEEGLTKNMAIDFAPEKPVTIREALKQILTPLELTFVHEQIVEENQAKSSRLRVTTLKKFRDEMVLKTYPVADLVVPVAAAGHTGSGLATYDYPVPMSFTGPSSADFYGVGAPYSHTGTYGPPQLGPPVGLSGPPAAVPSAKGTSHEALLELIRTTIEPDSWGKENQGGRIEFYSQTLSLVVRQRRGVHEQIANLLSSLRNEQGIQIRIECILFSAPDTLPEECRKILEEACIDTTEGNSLSEKSMKNLRAMLDAVDDIEILSRPKLTTFDNRGATFAVSGAIDPTSKDSKPHSFSVLMLPSVSEDRRQVRFKLAVNARDTYDAISRLRAVTVDSNAGALLDVTEELLQHNRTPGVDEVTRRLKAIERETRKGRTYLLLVPTIHVEEEEEELLGTDGGATRNGD